MKPLLLALVVLVAGNAARAEEALSPFESAAALETRGKIDEFVFARWKRLGIQPARPCSDAVFVRRAYLDVIGTLPSALEARTFLQDPSANKRSALIDRLLEREEFADYWAMKWCDLLRVKSEFPINLWPNAVQAYHRWIRDCLRRNVPYDQFVREMLTANGSNFRVPPVNFYRAVQSREPLALAQAVALTFMGVRPEAWPKERWEGMAGFFAQVGYKPTKEWKEEIVFFDPGKPRVKAVFPDGKPAQIAPGQDPRAVFAEWLISPKNPWFTRNIANRIWAWLMGRGIIHEPDDIRSNNPPSHPELLAYLEQEVIAARYHLKHLYRLILNSQTYQLSSVPRTPGPEAQEAFASYPLRRLEAEVLIDALCQITGTKEHYSSPIPEPFTYVPEDNRSIALADASITSPFLETFGRPPRDTGLESERNNRISPSQRLYLLNSSHIREKIENWVGLQRPTGLARGLAARPAAWRRRAQPQSDLRDPITELYLTVLSRFPTEEELKTATVSLLSGVPRQEAWADLVWALINSAEFLYRH